MAEYKPAKTMMYLLFGAAVGAACGVLFARKPGEETRAELLDWLKDQREKSRELTAKWRQRIPIRKDPHENHHKKELIRA